MVPVRGLAAAMVLWCCGCDAPHVVATGNPDGAIAPSPDSHDTPDGPGQPVDAATGPDAVTSMGAPRLIAPLSTSTVSQRQPTLRWTGSLSGTPVVDLYADRACTSPLPIGVTVAASGGSGKVDSPLPPGWVYWRVRSGTETSATWQFWVGVLSASSSVDNSTGTTFDVNGDGLADLLIGGLWSDTAYLYLGSTSGNYQSIVLTRPDGATCTSCFGKEPKSVGDVNGDGYSDFYITSDQGHVYLGGPTIDAANWNGATAPLRVDGYKLAMPSALGDVNGDGYADLLGGPGSSPPVYFGSAAPTPAGGVTLVTPDADIAAKAFFGVSYGAAGDVNGDGYADFVIGSISSEGDYYNGFAHVYLGSASPTAASWNAASTPSRIDLFTPHTQDSFGGYYGVAVGAAGDVNNDGYSDVLVGAVYGESYATSIVYPGIAHLYLGSAAPSSSDWSSLASARRIDLEGPTNMAQLGVSMEPVGDMNGDGYADFLVGEIDNLSVQQVGGARLYLGDPLPSASLWNGASPSKRVDVMSPDGSYNYFGRNLTSPGDMNGDGHPEFMISARYARHFYWGEALPSATDYNGSTAPKRIDVSAYVPFAP